MTSNRRNLLHIQKPLICIYTNQNRNEFAIGLEKDENFMAITKVGDSYTRFVDAYDQIINDENEVDWKLELKRWIAPPRKMNQYLLRSTLMVGIKKGKELTSCYTYKINLAIFASYI